MSEEERYERREIDGSSSAIENFAKWYKSEFKD